MPTQQAEHRTPLAATLSASAVILVGACVLHRTLSGTSDGESLSLWSIILALVWGGGGTILLLLTPAPSPDAAVSRLAAIVRPRPVLMSVGIGFVFATVSLIGALLMREIPAFGGDIGGARARVVDGQMLVFLVAAATGAAEELFFRIGLRRLVSARWFPIVSTVLYGLVTLAAGNIALFIAAVLLGAVSSAAFLSTERWYTPLIIHGFWTVALIGVFPLL